MLLIIERYILICDKEDGFNDQWYLKMEQVVLEFFFNGVD